MEYTRISSLAYSQADNHIVGLASLSPTDEEGVGGPQIIGIWILPNACRKGVGVQLLQVLVEESQTRYGHLPTIVGVSRLGNALIQKARGLGIPLSYSERYGDGKRPSLDRSFNISR